MVDQRVAERLDAMAYRLAQHLCVPDQVFGRQHPQHRQRRRGADRVAAEGAAVQAGRQQFGGRPDGQARTDGQPAAQSLGQCHDVRSDAVVLVSEKSTGAAHSGLHLVEHQQSTVPRRDISRGSQITLGRDDDTALPHDRFEEHCGGVVIDGGGQRVGVTVRYMRDVTRQRGERCLLGRLTGQSQRAHCSAVESTLRGNEFRATGKPGQLERQLVGLGSGVAEEHPRLGVRPQQSDQFFGQRDTRFGGIQVGGVAQGGHLLRDGLDDRGVAMAEDVDRNAAEQVHVGLAVHVGDHDALTAGQSYRRGAVIVHHHGFPPLPHDIGLSHGLTTLVPVPASVKSSTNTQCLTLPSITCALGTPPVTALRHASTLGSCPPPAWVAVAPVWQCRFR